MVDTTIVQQMVIDTLRQGEPIRLQIVSNSMSPLLQVNDLVEVEPKPFGKLQPGDIVVVSGVEMTVTHRLCQIVERDGQKWLVLRGDRVFAYDPPVPAANYIGTVTARVRNDRTLSLTAGRGAWLTHHAQTIATFEAKLFNGDVAQIDWSDTFMERGYNIGEKWHGRWLINTIRRTIRFFLFMWASLITSIVR